ncbi:hypothetical protein GR702_15990 [Novosphingobium sp. FGD1]|uniref:Uncharacterized protein n=1 Tax=Novosphingobium silvae TaxID=2692619 RepID=A0A7X4GKF1_9SPHN|nr:hypothetical protein [Novosphingobium silvae]MYL99269.1 hypothetical protein [Novosphingobium silvae]
MGRFTSILQWLLRHALLYGALVCAFGVSPFVAQAWRQASEREATFLGLSEVESRLRAEYEALGAQFASTTAGAENRSAAELDRLIAQTRSQRDAARRALGDRPGIMALYRRGPQALLADQQGRLQVALLDRQLQTLEAARDLVDSRTAQELQAGARVRLSQAEQRCNAAIARQQALERAWTYRLRSWIESEEHRQVSQERQRECSVSDEARNRLAAMAYREGAVERAQAALATSRRDLVTTFDEALADLSAERAVAGTLWQGSAVQKLRVLAKEWHLDRLLTQAFWALLVIVASPYLIRLLCWTVLAPLAERRASIRLAVPGGRGAAIPPSAPSTTSVPVRLGPSEELLVRQSFLQTTSHQGAKATQWLLDWRHPLASWASGLAFLTRIGGEGEVTTVSAVRDPFAEVTVLAMPEGASCVLLPRALAAVVQPVGRPLRITSHWRLGSLNAWLTLQLRYLVFHGPCRLVVKGGRGVRVERAERGRVFGQAQLVGFSADLAYSVSRTETFWPYLLGYEQLFKDKVKAGEGILVIEEAPMAGRGGRVRHGLEGAFDVATKAFGI